LEKKRVVIIGGGSTGCTCAHDLTLRGFEVIVIERGNIACSTTGRCSCDQHSGARYAVKDKVSAIECIEENQIARRIMPPGVMVENDGVFILLGEDDPGYADRFFDGCAECGIPVQEILPRELFRREPNVTKDVRRVGLVPDAVVEPLP
jgi:glycerol-3-phosphate dehydrogenase